MSETLHRKDPRFKKVSVTVEMYREWIINEDGYRQGLTRFRTFTTDALDDDDNLLGTIGGGTGAITLNKDGEEWTIHHDDLWYAFVEAIEAVEKLEGKDD